MEEEVYLIDIVALLSAQSGWIIFFILWIWVGMILIHYRLVQINSGIKDLNRHFQGLSPSPEKTPIRAKIGRATNDNNLKYCAKCEAGVRADRTSCPECSGTHFYLKN